jgi:AAA+ ATPase superfamily predicted ATPase
LAKLEAALQAVRDTGGGGLLSLRGRRQVGKSRLVEEFIERSGANAVFYVASRLPADDELEAFRKAIASSPAKSAEVAAAGPLGSWQAALAVLAAEATVEDPLIVVIDELPYLVDSYPPIEGVLQTYWDRTLEGKAAVLLVVVGSDISMMEALTTYGRPLYNRAEEIVVDPLSPAEVAELLGLDARAALEAYLVLGGFPRLASRWEKRDDLWRFVKRELDNPESSLIVLGERTLAAEFPADLKAQSVLRAIGSGERTFSGILQHAEVGESALATILDTLAVEKRVIYRSLPYSAKPRPKLSRYYVSDPYLRFWLRYIEGNLTTVQRGRGDVVLDAIKKDWLSYQGRAIEPIIRRAVEKLLPDARFGDAMFVGGYWNRDNSIEVDLVGGRAADATPEVDFIGSVKWHDNSAFDRGDLAALNAQRGNVPGVTGDTRLVGVSRTGFNVSGLDVELTADDIIDAYRA